MGKRKQVMELEVSADAMDDGEILSASLDMDNTCTIKMTPRGLEKLLNALGDIQKPIGAVRLSVVERKDS